MLHIHKPEQKLGFAAETLDLKARPPGRCIDASECSPTVGIERFGNARGVFQCFVQPHPRKHERFGAFTDVGEAIVHGAKTQWVELFLK